MGMVRSHDVIAHDFAGLKEVSSTVYAKPLACKQGLGWGYRTHGRA